MSEGYKCDICREIFDKGGVTRNGLWDGRWISEGIKFEVNAHAEGTQTRMNLRDVCPKCLHESMLVAITKSMGREAVLRLLGEPEPSDSEPQLIGVTLDGPITFEEMLLQCEVDRLVERLQKAVGLLGQALGRIEELERYGDSIIDDIQFLKDDFSQIRDRTKKLEKARFKNQGFIGKLLVLQAKTDERLAALEGQAATCRGGECECHQAGHDAAKSGG